MLKWSDRQIRTRPLSNHLDLTLGQYRIFITRSVTTTSTLRGHNIKYFTCFFHNCTRYKAYGALRVSDAPPLAAIKKNLYLYQTQTLKSRFNSWLTTLFT